MPPVSTDTQNTILTRQREGATITQIAQELGLSRTTVYKSLNMVGDWESWLKDKTSNINRLALNAVEKSVQRGNATVAMQWLTRTVLAPEPTLSIGDVTLQHLTLLPASTNSTPGTPGTPGSAMSTSTASPAESTVSTGTEAAAKPPQSDMSLSPHTNFSRFSDAELEAELERRRAARVIEAEVVP